ncbi:MAG: hypothetical protein KA354_18590 [Phycisphaerae bacterium]|nr:hypothetical protein [Phycisphaerae bacterium]
MANRYSIIIWCAVSILGQAAAAAESRPRPSTALRPPWKTLADYPRPPAPDTGWGIHDNPNCSWKPERPAEFFKELRSRYGFTWFKVLACGANKLDVVEAARRQGVEPVVRLYVDRPSPHYPRPGGEETGFRKLVRAYVTAGAHYIEAGNEPNLSLEWSEGEWDKGNRETRLCMQWLRTRRLIAEEGGIPVFYAMSVGGNDGRNAGQWWDDCFKTFAKMDTIEQAFAGCAFGVHCGPLNRPIDYPFNLEKNLPHATRQDRFDSLMKDNTTYLGVELLQYLMARYLPHPIPILGTEGGAFPDNHDDKNYPPVTPERHRDLNLEILRRFNPDHPRYWGDPLFAQMNWIYHADTPPFANDSWFDHPSYGRMPILEALEKEPRFDRGAVLGEHTPGRPPGPRVK